MKNSKTEENGKLCALFYSWWDEYFTKWTMQKLRDLLLLEHERDISLQNEIRRFHYEMNIHHNDEIAKFEIIRFKSINTVKWLYSGFKEHFHYIFSNNTMQDTIDILDYSITTAVDCVSSLPEIIENDERYNAFVERMIKTLMERLWLFSKITTPIKNKFIAAKRIQKHWRVANTTPSYLLCRNRLQKEYTDLQKHLARHQLPVLPNPPSPRAVSPNGASTSLMSM